MEQVHEGHVVGIPRVGSHLDLEILPIETDFWRFLPVAAVIQTFFAEV